MPAGIPTYVAYNRAHWKPVHPCCRMVVDNRVAAVGGALPHVLLPTPIRRPIQERERTLLPHSRADGIKIFESSQPPVYSMYRPDTIRRTTEFAVDPSYRAHGRNAP